MSHCFGSKLFTHSQGGNAEVLRNHANVPTVTSQEKNQPRNQKYVTPMQGKLHGGRYNGLACCFSIHNLRFVMLKNLIKALFSV